MKIAFLSDIHGDIESVQNFVKREIDSDIDLIILAGDIDNTNFTAGQLIVDKLGEMKKPILYVPGNDDTQDYFLEGAINIDCNKYKHGKFAIIGSGGAPVSSKLMYLYSYSEEQRFESLKELFQGEKNIIFVSHAPPKGILDKATMFGSGHIGSTATKTLINEYQPLVCICGHVHREGGKIFRLGNSKIINTALLGSKLAEHNLIGKRYCVLDFDNPTEKFNESIFKYAILPENITLEEFIREYL